MIFDQLIAPVLIQCLTTSLIVVSASLTVIAVIVTVSTAWVVVSVVKVLRG